MLTFIVQATGVIDPPERRGALRVINERNAALTLAHQQAVRDTPVGGTPPPAPTLLLLSTNPEIRTSYEVVMLTRVMEVHASYIAQAAPSKTLDPAQIEAWLNKLGDLSDSGAAPAQLIAILANLETRRAAGATWGSLVADSAT